MANCIINRTQDLSSINSSISSLQSGKQDKLVSGTNIKTINSTSLLGSGDIRAVKTTGDTMTGLLKIETAGNSLQLKNTYGTIANNQILRIYTNLNCKDVNIPDTATNIEDAICFYSTHSSAAMGVITSRLYKTGDTAIKIAPRAFKADGTEAVQHSLIIRANRDGTQKIEVSSAEAWRTGIGAQQTLTSGTNIKTINSTSLLGSGNIAVQPTLSTTEAVMARKIPAPGGTTASPTYYGAHGNIRKYGNVVSLLINAKWNGDIGPNTEIGTISTAYRPKDETSLNVSPGDGQSNPFITITTTGSVQIGGYSKTTNGNVIRAAITWIV